MNPHVVFRKVWTDSDGMLEVLVDATNGYFAGMASFYCYPEQLLEWATCLSEYAGQPEGECSREFSKYEGSPSATFHFQRITTAGGIYFRITLCEVDISERPRSPEGAQFGFACEVEAIARLSRGIVHLAQGDVSEAHFEGLIVAPR